METWQRTGSLVGPATPTPDERTWGMMAHLAAIIASAVGLPLLGPLVVLLTRGRDSAYVRAHAVESLNFQLTLFIAMVVSSVMLCLGVGFLLLPVVLVGGLVLTVIGTVKASNAELYHYPATLRIIS
jgi:uncharacterized protein